MKNLLKNKFLIGLVVVVLIIVILAVTGALKMNFSVTKTRGGSAEGETPTQSKGVAQSQQLMTKETTFKAAEGALTVGIKLPIGWSIGSNEQVDFVAGSQISEKLPGGGTFTVNLNSSAAKHPVGITSFADYEAGWTKETLAGSPSMEEVSSYSKKVNGVDVVVLEMLNTRPDGLVVHQIQYVYYLNDAYYLVATASAPSESWDKYSQVLKDSLESIRLKDEGETETNS